MNLLKNGSDYVLPNVSYVVDTDEVMYDPYTSPEPIILIDGEYYLDLFNKLQQIAEKYINKYNVTHGGIYWNNYSPMIITLVDNRGSSQFNVDIERSESDFFKCITFKNYPLDNITVYTNRYSTDEPYVHMQNANYRTGEMFNGQFTLIPQIS